MITINELIVRLENVSDKNKPVYFGFCGCVPRRISSWRGIYAYPALGWAATGYDNGGVSIEAPTVAELIASLKAGLSESHEGWKGGTYWFSGDEPLHIDNPGDYHCTAITAVEISWCVTLQTTETCD